MKYIIELGPENDEKLFGLTSINGGDDSVESFDSCGAEEEESADPDSHTRED